MSLLSNAPFSNVTVYRKDYYKKKGFRPPPYLGTQDFTDPLAGPNEEHILPYCKYKKLEKPCKYPEPNDYVEEICGKYPAARKVLKDAPYGPLNYDAVDKIYDDENRTAYMVDYCKVGFGGGELQVEDGEPAETCKPPPDLIWDYDSKVKQGRTTRPLPAGWLVPETTQRRSYRPPKQLAPEGISQIKITPPPENLRPNPRERAMLEIKTGDSDYMAIIGKTGQEIIEGKLHGDINVRPEFNQDDLLRAKLIRLN